MDEEKRRYWEKYDRNMKQFNRFELLSILGFVLFCAAVIGIGWMILR